MMFSKIVWASLKGHTQDQVAGSESLVRLLDMKENSQSQQMTKTYL